MNIQKLDCREGIQQNYELIDDFSNSSSNIFRTEQPWNMGISFQPNTMLERLEQPNLGPAKSFSTIVSGFKSPASAFYATEHYMGLPQYESQVEQADLNFEFANTLPSVAKSQLCSSQYYKSSEQSSKIPWSNFPGYKLNSQRSFSVSFDENQSYGVSCGSYNSPHAQLNALSLQEKQSSGFCSGGVSVTCGDSVSTGAVSSSKARIRWTQDLHEKFVECVNRLGGAEKATPKTILKLMNSDRLTILHVKSHLQKYRTAKYLPENTEGKPEKENRMNDVSRLDTKIGLHIKEALQLQLDVQRRLHEQLEIQRTLQLRIEEQGRQLKMMFEKQQQKTNKNMFDTQRSDLMSLE